MESRVRAGARATLAVYVVMIAAAIAAVLGIGRLGAHLLAPAPPAGAAVFGQGAANLHASVLVHVLLALVVVIVAARALGALFKYLHQPAVIGEVVAGIMLGPSLLGRLAPGASVYLLPKDVAPFISVLAQIGVILFMFLVGVELDTALLRKKTHATLAISHASIIVPFLLGTTFALWLYPRYATGDVPFITFALFLGVSMSVTAFPVLARILTDRGIHKSRIGVVAISCAAVDDVTAWCLLALVVSVAQAHAGSAATTVALTVAYVAFVFGLVRPAVRAWVRKQELRGVPIGQSAVAVVFLGLLLSALVTEVIGIHAPSERSSSARSSRTSRAWRAR